MPWSLDLADYRRRVAELYLAEPTGGPEGWSAFRQRRDSLFREHPQSALAPGQRSRLETLPFFDYDGSYRVPARFEEAEKASELEIDTGGEDGVVRYRRVGHLRSALGRLTLFWIAGYGGGLFLPFRDRTSGHETYGGGRYLTDTIKGTFGRGLRIEPDGVVLDFNYAYNPSCAYNVAYACPLAPRENWLDIPVRAGELTFPHLRKTIPPTPTLPRRGGGS